MSNIEHRTSNEEFETKSERESHKCSKCRFLQIVEGAPEPIFFCKRKAGFERRNWHIAPGQSCINFERMGPEPGEIEAIGKTGARVIPLSQGKYAIVDAEDYGRLCKYQWCAVKQGECWYAKTLRRDGWPLAMHRMVANAPKGMMVDHINHNGLDNRKPNLRLCTHQQNQQNRRPKRGGSSKYKGVSWSKARMKFRATICNNGKSIYLGEFVSEIEAAKAYDKAAKKYFGQFAYLNFPEGATESGLS